MQRREKKMTHETATENLKKKRATGLHPRAMDAPKSTTRARRAREDALGRAGLSGESARQPPTKGANGGGGGGGEGVADDEGVADKMGGGADGDGGAAGAAWAGPREGDLEVVDADELFSDLGDDELAGLGLAPVGLDFDEGEPDRAAYAVACQEGGVTAMTSVLARLAYSAMSLRHALIGDAGAAALAAALPCNAHITTLCLAGNDLSDKGAISLSMGLAATRTITALDVADNRISDAGGAALVAVYASDRNASLRSLSLARNRCKDGLAAALATHLAAHASLRALDVGGNAISRKAGARALAKLLRGGVEPAPIPDGSPLLDDTRIHEQHAAAMVARDAAAGAGGSSDADDNTDGDDAGGSATLASGGGATVSGGGVASSRWITSLSLAWCNLGGEGGVVLARAALLDAAGAPNSALTALDLAMNGLTDVAGVTIGDALRRNGSLRLLDLSRNRLGAPSGRALARAMRRNSALQVPAHRRRECEKGEGRKKRSSGVTIGLNIWAWIWLFAAWAVLYTRCGVVCSSVCCSHVLVRTMEHSPCPSVVSVVRWFPCGGGGVAVWLRGVAMAGAQARLELARHAPHARAATRCCPGGARGRRRRRRRRRGE